MGKRGPQPKDTCRQGHDLTEENIYFEGARRRCLACKRARARRNYHRDPTIKLAYKRWYCYGDPEGRSWQEVKETLL